MTKDETSAWLRGVASAVAILARYPAGMTARGMLHELQVRIDELEEAGALDSDIRAIKDSRP